MSNVFSTAMSALQTTAVGIDVHANNVANLNTTGYKSQSAQFKTLFSQQLRTARGSSSGLGGLDPLQVGAGVQLASTSTSFTQGSLTNTGQNLDLAIKGKGFFMLGDNGGNQFFTRDGSLTLDANGQLTQASSGLAVQGLLYDTTTNSIPAGALPQNITIPPGLTLNAKATANATIAGNVDAGTPAAGTTQMQFLYHDSFGVSHTMTVNYTKNAAANTWDWTATVGSPAATVGSGQLVFDAVGNVNTGGTPTVNLTAASGGVTAGGVDPQPIELDMTHMTQFAATSEVASTNQDGFPPGSLTDVVADDTGQVSAVFSNGQTRPLAQLAIANFANVEGLNRASNNLYQQSANTGSPQIVTAGTAGVGTIQSQTLEQSNTDLASELTTMIILQRGYQASTKMITTADEMIQDALSLKR